MYKQVHIISGHSSYVIAVAVFADGRKVKYKNIPVKYIFIFKNNV